MIAPGDPSRIDLTLDSRAVTFENPTGERGAGGETHGGRKGRAYRDLEPGERVVLCDLEGPGTIRHIWMTFPPARPEVLRALWLEVFYDDASEPSVSVPCLDFFGLPLGRAVHYVSAMTSAQEGRGFNSYFPMPFRSRIRIECTNGAPRSRLLFYQIDYTREVEREVERATELGGETGLLHCSFRRENPTTLMEDFTIARDFVGPGRFLGCNVGIRTLPQEHFVWYGEGEVKIFRDGDDDVGSAALPTICGTGLEDYVGSAWGMGPHFADYGGAPLDVRDPDGRPVPDFVGFYRWHVPDPIVFASELRVTIQQIGYRVVPRQNEAELAALERDNPWAGGGPGAPAAPEIAAQGIAERVDDYCATAYVYCRDAQPVPRLDPALALADIARRPYEERSRGVLPGA